MNDGPKKPTYEPPKLGGEMERHGLVYDTTAALQEVPRAPRQKRSRNRNKNNRRDNNRPKKELQMVNGTEGTMNGSDAAKHEGPARIPGDGIFALTEVLQEHLKEQKGERGELRAHFKEIGSTLSSFNASAKELVEGMEATATRSREAAETAMHIPARLNKVLDKDNLKGRVAQAAITVAVGYAVAGAIFLGVLVFGKKAETVEVETPSLPAAAPKKVA